MAKASNEGDEENPFGLPERNASLFYFWNSSRKVDSQVDLKAGQAALRKVILILFVGLALVALVTWKL